MGVVVVLCTYCTSRIWAAMRLPILSIPKSPRPLLHKRLGGIECFYPFDTASIKVSKVSNF